MLRRLLAFVAVLAVAACGSSDRPPGAVATVARSGDGDTLDLAGGVRVRLLQIDSPELGEGRMLGRARIGHLARAGPARGEAYGVPAESSSTPIAR